MKTFLSYLGILIISILLCGLSHYIHDNFWNTDSSMWCMGGWSGIIILSLCGLVRKNHK